MVFISFSLSSRQESDGVLWTLRIPVITSTKFTLVASYVYKYSLQCYPELCRIMQRYANYTEVCRIMRSCTEVCGTMQSYTQVY